MNLLLWPERLLFRSESESKEDDVDELDRAQELAALFNERCLAGHMRQAHQNTPAARLAVLPDAVCCVDCQTLREA
ncbi:TraR/DksA family transcriptional regulator [Salmonella enterica subsp. enterica serovar Rubislaw]|nr:TraR/DksA family transcriptional regulator [Salmonella enterica subsp. enterica serovar Rubislaw]